MRIGLILVCLIGPSAPLGSTKYAPSPENPIGWRGDGSGRYPGATPPTQWERRKAGNSYATRNLLWASPLPNNGVSTPIIVGPRLFVTCEPSDLVCIEKASGRILWIRSNMACEAVPEVAKTLAPHLAELAKLNAEAVEDLNGQLGSALASGPKESNALKKKRELEKKITEAQVAADKKLFGTNWAQAVFGFAGQTPTSDGKRVCAFFTSGVSVGYDLDGHRKWIARGEGMGSEHGNFASPLLIGGQLVVWANEMRGYDVESGKLLWTAAAKASNTYGSLFAVRAGAELVAGFQSGYFVRIRDGKRIWGDQAFGDAVSTPIVEGGVILAHQGYPIANDATKGLKAFKIPTSEGAKPQPAYAFKAEWAENEIPADKKTPFNRGFVASPLYHDGLVYQLTEGGGLLVNDASTGDLVYRKVLPMKPKTEYWNWAGASASPTLAGKQIYLMDNQGTTIVLQPGRVYKELALNMIEDAEGNGQAQNLATPVFEGTRMYYRNPRLLFCVGEK